jgi:hypothetical protein
MENEGMKDGRAAALEEAGTRRMVSAGLAKKVTLFFSPAQHMVKTISLSAAAMSTPRTTSPSVP